MLSMSIFVFLLLTAIGICGTIYWVIKKKTPKLKLNELLKRASLLGIFLLVFDFVFENLGFVLGYWSTSGSIFKLGAVPIEVMAIAFCAGFTYYNIFPKEFDLELGIFSSMLIAAAGTAIESILIYFDVLTYTGGWTSLHAYLAYFGTFLLMYKVVSLVK